MEFGPGQAALPKHPVAAGGIACVLLAIGLARAVPSFWQYDAHHPVP